MNIFLDFDGTVVEHDYPQIGKLNPNSLEVIKRLQDAGHTIILNTMRVEFNDNSLEETLNYFEINGIKIAKHTKFKKHPLRWDLDNLGNELYIDDIATNIPLIKSSIVDGFMVDWVEIENQLINKDIL